MTTGAGVLVPAVDRRAAAQRPARGDAAAEAARAAGVLLGPAVVGRIRDRADPDRARARRARAAAPDRLGRSRGGALLAIVVASYRQTCEAYPNGGGAYAVSRANLGENASLTAASALLIDYVLTVAVSVVAGVAAITSAVPALAPHAVELSLGFVVVLAVDEPARGQGVGPRVRGAHLRFRALRSTRCSPSASLKVAFGDGITAESAQLPAAPGRGDRRAAHGVPAPAGVRVGCTALTGVEAVSNGVPAFEQPKSRNAATTLLIMGALATTMFAGITALALAAARAHGRERRRPDRAGAWRRAEDGAQPDRAGDVRRDAALLPAAGFTAAILILAANTAFNGFPVLSSLLGRDNYLPHQLSNRGDRLVFSNGIVMLALVAGAADRRLQRRRDPADPALHPRRVPLLHPQPGGDGAPLGARDSTGASTQSARRCGASGRERHRRGRHRAGVRDRVGDQVRPGRVDRGARRADPLPGDEGDQRHYGSIGVGSPPRPRAS